MVGLLHSKNIEGDAIQATLDSINTANFLVVEVILDFITIDVLRPVATLFNKCSCKDTFFLELDEALKHAEATVQDNNLSCPPQFPCQP